MANTSYGGAATSSYYDLARQARIFTAFASQVTAPVIYSTAAGTGGPLLWNGTGGYTTIIPGTSPVTVQNVAVDAVILGVFCNIQVLTTVAGEIGLTGNVGQAAAPTSTSAITTVKNTHVGGPAPLCTAYKVGTVTNAGNFFLPLIPAQVTAITADNTFIPYIPLEGMFVVPPGGWVALAASATLTTLVADLGLVWAEIPRL